MLVSESNNFLDMLREETIKRVVGHKGEGVGGKIAMEGRKV